MTTDSGTDNRPWYSGITRYQWLILVIACLGWIFDVYEGQIFNLTRGDMLNELLASDYTDDAARKIQVDKWGDWFLAAFLLGGTAGGLLFGSLADRYGRRPIMIATILTYSAFSGLTYFATDLWQIAALRFFVAMGVGGEWAVAAALVAEVFPKHARTHASGIFHASSVVGTWGAAIAGMAVGAQWRYAYLIGIIPALLVLWVRAKVKEPESWKKSAGDTKKRAGSYLDLFGDPRWRKHALLGMALAGVGLASFWAVGVATQGLAKEMLTADGATLEDAGQKAKFAYGIVQTAGAGVGLLAFGPLCARWGRRRAFIFGHIGAFLIVPITCYLPQNYNQLLCILPVFGFFTLCMHAGYAIYFPELFPNHLRATGTSFCFNVGRIIAAPMLILSGMVKAIPGLDIREALCILATTFLLGLLVVAFLPETKGQELPE
jgi:MFS family permease